MRQKPRVQVIASRIAGAFGIGFYNLYYVEKNLADDILKIETPIELKIRYATSEDLADIIKYLENKDRENFEYNIGIKSKCYVAVHDNKIAGYSWVNRKHIYIDGMKLARLPDNGSYNTDSYVFPAYRGNKIFQKLIAAVYMDMKKAGCTFTANIVAKDNAPSIAARKRFGVKFQTIYVLRLPGPTPLTIGKGFVMGLSAGSSDTLKKEKPDNYKGKESYYWTSIACKYRCQGTGGLWRKHSNAVNRRLVERWMPSSTQLKYILKTDMFDELYDSGLIPVLKSRACHLLGMDISAPIADFAGNRLNDIRVIAADVRRLPFAVETFDAIVSVSTLDHFEEGDNISRSLKELYDALREGGRLIITLDNPANPLIALRRTLPFALLKSSGLVPYYVGATIGPRRLRQTLENIGFEVKEMDAVMHCPRVLAVAIARILEKCSGTGTRKRFLRTLMVLEQLSCLPTRFLTGHFVAAKAVKKKRKHG